MYGDIDERFYVSMMSMYDKVICECNKNEPFYALLKDRLYALIEESAGIGWGYHDGLCEIYYSLKMLEEAE